METIIFRFHVNLGQCICLDFGKVNLQLQHVETETQRNVLFSDLNIQPKTSKDVFVMFILWGFPPYMPSIVGSVN